MKPKNSDGNAGNSTKKPQKNSGQQAQQINKGAKKPGYAGAGSTVRKVPHLAGQSVEDTLAHLAKGPGAKKQHDKENRRGACNDAGDEAGVAARAKAASISVLKEAYTATNTQEATGPMPFLKLYPSFVRPEFYQPPQWRYQREAARGQNSSQKSFALAGAAQTLSQHPVPAGEDQKESDSSDEAQS